MVLGDLIEGLSGLSQVVGDRSTDVVSLGYDSRSVERGGCFFATVGVVCDGHYYIGMAVERGASAVVCERLPEEIVDGVCYVVVESSPRAMGAMASRFYGDPSRDLKLVGITGTNGKTTTATLLADLFEALGYSVGLISTVVYRIGGERIDSTHTTPDVIRLNQMLRRMVDAGCEYCFMEVSSHAVVQERICGLHFEGCAFTNLTHDHLDYHGSFAEYLRAKKRLFDGLGRGSFALVNIDDRNGEVMVQNCAAKIYHYSLRSMADFRAKVLEMHFDGMLLTINDSREGSAELWARLLGRFNAYNLLTVYAVARLLGVSRDEILPPLSALGSVDGRFEHITAPEGRTIIIDYAHTPDALQKVLETVLEIANGSNSGGSSDSSDSPCSVSPRGIITVCGCGGDRDAQKRPQMARIAYEGSTTAIFTSDNPRSEDPEAILSQMIAGVTGEGCVVRSSTQKRWLKVADRAEAIRMAVALSQAGDVILVAGKGHEKYQIVAGVKHHFDDHEQVQQAVEQYLK